MPPIQHIRLSDAQEKELSLWLDGKLSDFLSRLENRIPRWKRYRELYEGKTKAKTFPWKNCSNVFLGVIGADVDAIHANMMNRLFSFGRVWDVGALHTKETVGRRAETGQPITWIDLAKSTQDYLAWESSDQGPMQVYAVLEQHILECIKLGTSVIYQPYLTVERKHWRYNTMTGDVEKGVEETLFDGPSPQVIPLEDFVILPNYSRIHGPQASPVVGHRYWLRKSPIVEQFDAGWFRSVGDIREAVLASPGGENEDLKDAQAQAEGDLSGVTEALVDDYQFFDLWCEVDINGDDREESVFLTFHRPTGKIVRIQPYIYKTRPYTASRYITREHRFYGIGLPELLESMQSGLNTNVNQAIDNVTVANTRGLKVLRNSRAASSLTDWYPGRKIIVDAMDELADFQVGEVYPSAFEVGRLLERFMDRRAGIADPSLGRDIDPRTPATSIMTVVQESSRRFDLYAKDIRKSLSELGMQALELIQQFKPTGRIYRVMGSEGPLVEQTLVLPSDISLREHLLVTTASSAGSSNREIARQNAMSGFSVLTAYLDKLLNYGGAIVSPQTPPPLKKVLYDAVEVLERVMERVLETFDLRDITNFLPQLEKLYGQATATAQAPLQQPALGGPPGVPDGPLGGEPGPGLGTGGQPGGPPGQGGSGGAAPPLGPPPGFGGGIPGGPAGV